jgi:uncharacterized membrane protein (UPF0136 family)
MRTYMRKCTATTASFNYNFTRSKNECGICINLCVSARILEAKTALRHVESDKVTPQPIYLTTLYNMIVTCHNRIVFMEI